VNEGHLYIHTDKADYIAKTHDVFIAHPHEYHTVLRPASQYRTVVCALSFYLEENHADDKAKIATQELRKVLNNTHVFRDDSNTFYLFFQQIKTAFSNKQPCCLAAVKALITALLVSLVQNLYLQSPNKLIPAIPSRYMEREEIIEGFFFRNYMHPCSIEDLAELLHLCTRRVNQLIHQLYGCSFSQKLNATRIEIAKLRLLYSEDSICDIGSLCGFNSPNYFFTTFRSIVGLSPREYRRNTKVPFPGAIHYQW
jgi:AraC-like DNA-binding protein